MPDREIVKQGIKCHLVSKSCAGCPYESYGARCIDALFQDIFELLELDERLEDDMK